MKRSAVTVIMVSYHTGPCLEDALEAAASDPDIAEVILVDNGNPKEARSRLQEQAFRLGNVRLLQGHGNIGFARACNYGAALAQTETLLFLNPDAVIEPSAVCHLHEASRSLDHPWLAGGLIIDADGKELRGSRRGLLTPLTAVTSFTPLRRLPGIPDFNRNDEPMPDSPVPMPTISGAFLMTDRTSFRAVGGFDEGYFLHIEDIALCREVHRLGGTVWFVPSARALHHGATSNVSNFTVEAHKFRGFLRYFRTGDGALSGVKTGLIAPILATALFGRSLWRSVIGTS